jgi:hypothetical protein
MKRFIAFAITLSLVLSVSSVTIQAQGRGKGPAVVNPGQARRAERIEVPDRNRSKDIQDINRDRDADKRKTDWIERNPQLNERLSKMLPAGMQLSDAASDFKNRGQFIAALHVSQNLGIPFADLKARMTGPDAKSLGQAIQDIKPDLAPRDARKEAQKAEKQAKETEKIAPTS